MNSQEQEQTISGYLIKRGELMPVSALPAPVPLLLDWQQALLGASGRAGDAVRLTGEAELNETGLLEHLEALKLIVVEFSSFIDGRGFSLAAQLRQDGFKGELRATGEILIDQLHYLQRCGFDAFELGAEQDSTVALEALEAFSKAYQPGW